MMGSDNDGRMTGTDGQMTDNFDFVSSADIIKQS